MPGEMKKCDNCGFRIFTGTLCDRCIIENLKTVLKAKDEEIERLKVLLQRCKKTFEPFPIVSDLKSMTQTLREKHDETETEAIKKIFKDKENKNRKLYQDIVKALKGEPK